MTEMLELIGLITISCIALFNFGMLISIGTYGFNHMYETFTWRGVWRSHPNLNEFGCLIVLLLGYIFLLPAAIVFWVARLFLRSDYF